MKGKSKRVIGLTFAWNGICEAFKKERNFQIHCYVGMLVIIWGFFLRLTAMEWVVVLLAIAIVLITELLNSVIERIIDYVKPEQHPKAKIIKDMAAAAVLIAACLAVMIGCIIIIPKLF